MTKIKHDSFRNVKAIIGSYEVEFDAEGNAVVTDDTALSIQSIAGFTVLAPEPDKEDENPAKEQAAKEAAAQEEADREAAQAGEEQAANVVRQPAVEDADAEAKKTKGRPKKAQ